MNRDEHLAKAERIMRSLGKLRPENDPLCMIDGAVIAGYHLGNALLHASGVSGKDTHFNTPSKLDRPLPALPREIRPAFEAFTELERLRSHYVRSPNACDERAAKLAWQHLRTMARHCGIAA